MKTKVKNKNQTILKILCSWAAVKHPQPIALYGFGSFFTKEQHAESDLDLGILLPQPLSNTERWNLQEELAQKILMNVDLVDLKNTSPVMATQIIGEGKLLYCTNEDEKNTFETLIYSSYAKLNEERKEILQDIFKTGSVYGR